MNRTRRWQSLPAITAVLLLNAAWQTFAILHSLPERLQALQSPAFAGRTDSTNLIIFFGSEACTVLAVWAVAALAWQVNRALRPWTSENEQASLAHSAG